MLEELEEAVSVSVRNKALLSYRSPFSAEEAAACVAAEVFVRQSVSSLRETLDGIVGGLTEEEKLLLEYKFFRRKQYLPKGRVSFPFSERSYFRRQDALLNKIAALLLAAGWTERRFEEETGDLFVRLLAAIRSGKEQALVKRRREGGFQSSALSSKEGCRLPRTTRTAMPTAATQATAMTAMAAAESPLCSSSSASSRAAR